MKNKTDKRASDKVIRVANVKVKTTRKGGYKVKPRRYRLTLVDENRMQPKWSVSTTRLRMFAFSVFIILIVAFMGALLLGTTPLRSILPGYLRHGERSEMYGLADRMDSLTRSAAVNRAYIDNIKNIFTADVDSDIDSVLTPAPDSGAIVHLPLDSILKASNIEREFVRHYEERERFNTSILTPIAAEGMVFYPPVNITPLAESIDANGRVTMSLSGSSPLSAVYRGTIVDCYYTPSRGYTIIIQHPNEFISRYTGLASSLVERGQKVKTGERLGLSTPPTADDSKHLPVTVEMWYNGSQINPKSYITF